ncbi:MAG: type II toxin-antitoxin system HipA family toxin [Rhodothermaceae bacterium]|nr:type II toxin-antitoxin system HipA family toxin [Rhodothermaceae bacterium]MYC04942.1 type II toxin-antitoxin system HipA family toxin [Rhodothermaceae bacterium]MYI16645.1 type II toxin-antitoxin system HipA family toxin [Rhodothermaceae bacterium]
MRHKPVQHIRVGLDFGSNPGPVGHLALRDRQIYFEYDADFIRRDLDLSPFHLPLNPGLQTFHTQLFEGLPGVFNDSLPDGWGRLLLDGAMRKRGVVLRMLSPLDRLAYVGKSGMGALIYEPDHSEALEEIGIDLDWFSQQSQNVMEGGAEDVLDELLTLNGSSAGARPKALIGFNRETGRIIHGSQVLPKGYEPWIVKFANSQDGPDAGAVEFVYAEMARWAGLMIPETYLFPAKRGAGYFAIKRFDQSQSGRLHMHTACGLLHSDHRIPALDYQDLLELTLYLTRSIRESEKIFQYAVFNVMAHNRDDHSKNFSFLMDETGAWKVSPAYDLTFSYGPGGEQSTMVMGEGKSPSMEHLRALGRRAEISDAKAEEILGRTKDSLGRWSELAKVHGVRTATHDLVHAQINRLLN